MGPAKSRGLNLGACQKQGDSFGVYPKQGQGLGSTEWKVAPVLTLNSTLEIAMNASLLSSKGSCSYKAS